MVTFDNDYSVELCGGTHVNATGQVGLFKIISESAIAAGIRRIEAITAEKAEQFVETQSETLHELKALLKHPKDILKGAQKIIDENASLQKEIKDLKQQQVKSLESELFAKRTEINGINLIAEKLDIDIQAAKDLAFRLIKKKNNLFLLIGTISNNKANLTLAISENLIKDKNLNAGLIIRDLAREIQGGGGGQPHFATAGGKNPGGFKNAFSKAKELLRSK